MRIYYPEGQAPYTTRVDLHEAESEVAGNSWLSSEAEALLFFHNSDGIPDRIHDYKLVGEGEVEGIPYADYSK